MAHPNGQGGWTITDEEAAEVLRASGGKLEVTVILKGDPESWNAPPPRFVTVAADEAAAKRWIQDEVDGRHRDDNRSQYMQGKDADWWIERGQFHLKTVEVQE